MQQQHRQQRALAGASDGQRLVGVVDFERPQDAEFDAQSRDRIAPVVTALKPCPGTIRDA
jgi:hypothetical protein